MSEPAGLTEKAQRLLKDPDLLDRACDLIGDLGLVGEEANRRMVLLSGIGGRLGEPIHLIIKGGSSGGKNTLANTALRLLPKDTVLATSGLSPQALAYYGEGGDGDEMAERAITGVLLIDEAEGLQGAEYSLRQAMSEGRVSRLTVGKDGSGSWGGKKLEVDVTASVITTTTKTALHRENQTRVFDLWIDESEEQTRRVLRAMGDEAARGKVPGEIEKELAVWHEAIGLLEPVEVVIPFAHALAEAFPATQLRMRRDFKRVLSLMAVSALLHQRRRLRLSDRRVIADLADYQLVHQLLQEILEPTIQGLTPTAHELCALHDELAGDEDAWVRRKDLEKEAGRRRIASPNTVHDWCRKLTNYGYWQGQTRGPYDAWWHRKIRDPEEEPVLLPRPQDLEGPDLPMGPNSLIGRSTGRNHGDSEGPPTSHAAERSDEDSEPASDVSPSREEDWEASDGPQQDWQKSSQAPNWDEVGPAGGDGQVSVPGHLVGIGPWPEG